VGRKARYDCKIRSKGLSDFGEMPSTRDYTNIPLPERGMVNIQAYLKKVWNLRKERP